MTNAELMRNCMFLVEQTTKKLDALVPIIANEVERRFGHKIARAGTEQERNNLRHFYTVQIGRENIWKQTYLSDRDLYLKLATMYGIAALVNQTSVTNFPETQ